MLMHPALARVCAFRQGWVEQQATNFSLSHKLYDSLDELGNGVDMI